MHEGRFLPHEVYNIVGITRKILNKYVDMHLIEPAYIETKVDTGKHAVCDHCGGPYWDDEEWKNIRNRKVG